MVSHMSCKSCHAECHTMRAAHTSAKLRQSAHWRVPGLAATPGNQTRSECTLSAAAVRKHRHHPRPCCARCAYGPPQPSPGAGGSSNHPARPASPPTLLCLLCTLTSALAAGHRRQRASAQLGQERAILLIQRTGFPRVHARHILRVGGRGGVSHKGCLGGWPLRG